MKGISLVSLLCVLLAGCADTADDTTTFNPNPPAATDSEYEVGKPVVEDPVINDESDSTVAPDSTALEESVSPPESPALPTEEPAASSERDNTVPVQP